MGVINIVKSLLLLLYVNNKFQVMKVMIYYTGYEICLILIDYYLFCLFDVNWFILYFIYSLKFNECLIMLLMG